MSVELLAAIALVIILVAIGIWRLIASWGGQKAKGAVAKDDLKEADSSLEAIDRAREAKRKAPGNVADLVKSARRGVRKRKR